MSGRLQILLGVDRIQRKAKILMGGESVSKTLDTLEHHSNMGVAVLKYKYIQRNCSIHIKEICPPIKSFAGTTVFPSISPEIASISYDIPPRPVVL